ncbi:MAG: zinc ribbon domain-containing protein [Anaerolineales bacterium]|nr:zinc ribbon domain-containing protein [Anaerolineales bacterium]
MQCVHCGHENNPDALFCSACGKSLKNTCPACQHDNQPRAHFCEKCGQRLSRGKSGLSGTHTGVLGAIALCGLIALASLLMIKPFSNQAAEVAPTKSQATAAVDDPGRPVQDGNNTVCPEVGAVILYWNPEFECTNQTGDSGYRLHEGEGALDYAHGAFDNQAASIRIPDGWSVKLWEETGQTGGSVCLNNSQAEFSSLGNFPDTDVPVSGRVSSITVYQDPYCGDSLASTDMDTASGSETTRKVEMKGRCAYFTEMEIKVTFLEWKWNPLQLYFKMPGGVPGQEIETIDPHDTWEYRLRIGEYESSECEFIPGYEERLYCSISLPAEYSQAAIPLSLYVNQCEAPIYYKSMASIPYAKEKSSSDKYSACNAELNQGECLAARGIWKESKNYCYCVETSSCGEAPDPTTGCDGAYGEYCACRSKACKTDSKGMAVCYYP